MNITQIYGLDEFDHAKLEMCLTREDVEMLRKGCEVILHKVYLPSHAKYIEAILVCLGSIIDEAER